MHKVTKIAALVSALLPASVIANTIEGVVINNNGKAVSGANIEVEGTIFNAVTDKNGRFILRNLVDGQAELHVSAAGFSHHHQDISVKSNDTKQVTFTLKPSPIEVIDVSATPIHMSSMESAAPVSVLAGEELRRQQASSLGDSLEKMVGVHTSFHGKVASTPIIRGLSGPRVLIAQNGLDVSDVSRVGPDHSVASEASTAHQIEVLRGPATLFYGSGAIGGVVNVVDGRIPKDSTTRGEWLLETNSVDDQRLASFNLTTGNESFAFYADAYFRESNDYDVPVSPELESEEEHEHSEGSKVVENSAEKSDGFTVGASYLFDTGYFGVSVETFNREYGIPGHSHGEEESHDEDEEEGHEEDEHGEEENVYADLEQTRVQLQGEFNLQGEWISKVQVRGGYTDYQHVEIEEGEVGTLFENDTSELRVDLVHTQLDGWNGAVSLHYKDSSAFAAGEEAFTPASDTETFAFAIMEEKHFGDVLLQVGARVERVTIDSDSVSFPEVELHGHEEDEDGHEEEHDDEESHGVFSFYKQYTPLSLSAGIVWDFTPGYNIGVSVSRSERAPSSAELLSFGPHIGTGTYEVGALFALHQENGESEIELSEESIDLETANNIDLTFRKTEGSLGFVFNAFYNQINDYYYQSGTGLFAEAGHGHEEEGEEESGEDIHTDELPVFIFQTDDVILHGFEAQVAWQATDNFKATVFSDFVRARLKDGGDLPRTPPLRVGTQFSYQTERLSAHFDIINYQKQDNVAAEETTTDGYTLVDANVSYDLSVFNHDMQVYLKGSNLTDREARVHSSFLKDVAPRPGRSIAFGIRGSF